MMHPPLRSLRRALQIRLLPLLLAVPAAAAPAAPPNVILVVADDLGFSDVGCYGGEIDTPNLDRLAAEGLRFSRFRVQPMCTTSRVSLLAGVPLRGGADMSYSDTVAFPTLLQGAGWTTSMVGKWHAGKPDARDPAVFDRYFGFLSGMTDSFAGGDDWYENDKLFRDFRVGFYSTHDLTSRALQYLDTAAEAGQPHFLYVSYNAPHHPCQAPRETVEKYLDRYAAGYDVIRAGRIRRQAEEGLFDGSWPPAEPGAEVLLWDELSESRRAAEVGKMAAYAATVDEIDREVGRILDHLDAAGTAENTLVVFLSDNGADYGNGDRRTDTQQVPWEVGANPTSSNGWAWVKNTPFRSYKHAAYEGGIASPLIARWPAGIQHPAGSVLHAPAHITDLSPTLLELAGASYPQNLEPLAGASLLPLFAEGGQRTAPPQFSWYQTSRAWIDDEVKAVRLYEGPWELYDLHADRTETTDLAEARPDQLAALVAAWNAAAEPALRVGVEEARENTGPTGWGVHRLENAGRDRLVSLQPANATVAGEPVKQLVLTFDGPLAFSGGNKGIRLFSADSDEPIWEASPGADHPAQGRRRVVFDGLPELSPDAAYFVEWDAGWVRVGGKPLGPLNDGAFWWRFRTPADGSPGGAHREGG